MPKYKQKKRLICQGFFMLGCKESLAHPEPVDCHVALAPRSDIIYDLWSLSRGEISGKAWQIKHYTITRSEGDVAI
jgi:hypothetical protein